MLRRADRRGRRARDAARRRRSAACSADPGQIEQVLMNLVGQRARRDAGRRHAHDRDARTSTSTRRTPARAGGAARALRAARASATPASGMDDGDPGAHLRAVLHHQGAGQGHRARALDGVRHRQAERRPHRASTASPGAAPTFTRLPPARSTRRRTSVDEPETAPATPVARQRDGPAGRGRGHRARPRAARSSQSRGYTVLEAADGSEALGSPTSTRRRSTCC